MYNPVKPKFSDAVKALLVFTLVLVVVHQNIVISDLTKRMNRIESEERDVNSIADQFQELIENMDEMLVIHDNQIKYQQIEINVLENHMDTLDNKIDSLENENEELRAEINNLNKLLLNISIENDLLLTPPVVEPRKTLFRIGDTMTWNIESAYPLEGAKITTWFPNGTLAWETEEFSGWLFRDGVWTIPYYTQVSNSKPMTFYDEYPIGNYTYRFTYRDIFRINGSFEVHEWIEQTLETS
jgi:hypothetical protein